MLLPLLLQSCIEVLEYKIQDEDYARLAINALASPDTTVSVEVSRVFNYNELPDEESVYVEKDLSGSFWGGDTLVRTYEEYALVKDADVKISVNGGSAIGLTYDAKSQKYLSDYRPKAGAV